MAQGLELARHWPAAAPRAARARLPMPRSERRPARAPAGAASCSRRPAISSGAERASAWPRQVASARPKPIAHQLGQARVPGLQPLQLVPRPRSRRAAQPQPLAQIVQPLGRPCPSSVSGRGRPRASPSAAAPSWSQPARHAVVQPDVELAGLQQQVAPHRHRHLGRRRGRRRPPVGDVVDQRGVGLVADGRDQRDACWRRPRGPRPPR